MTSSAADGQPPVPGVNLPWESVPSSGGDDWMRTHLNTVTGGATNDGGGGLGYHVDMENAPQVVANLTEAAHQLNVPLDALREKCMNIPAPGQDEVSLAAARNLNKMGRDCHAALAALQKWCLDNAERLSRDLATYHKVEVENVQLPLAAPW